MEEVIKYFETIEKNGYKKGNSIVLHDLAENIKNKTNPTDWFLFLLYIKLKKQCFLCYNKNNNSELRAEKNWRYVN